MMKVSVTNCFHSPFLFFPPRSSQVPNKALVRFLPVNSLVSMSPLYVGSLLNFSTQICCYLHPEKSKTWHTEHEKLAMHTPCFLAIVKGLCSFAYTLL